MKTTANGHADNLSNFIVECGHLWDEERVKQVEAAADYLDKTGDLIAPFRPLYELIDESDDEVYYPIGLFRSVNEANEAITTYFAEHQEPPMYEDSAGDGVKLLIRCRQFGFEDNHKRIKVRTFSRDWSRNDSDDFQWHETTTDNI